MGWHIQQLTRQSGPHTDDEVIAAVHRGLEPATKIRSADSDDWIPVFEHEVFGDAAREGYRQRLELMAHRAAVVPYSTGIVVLKAARGGVWGLTAAAVVSFLVQLETAMMRANGAPQQAAACAYALAWMVAAYVVARAADRILADITESRLHAARLRAAKGE